MHKPELDEKQDKVLSSMIDYWDEVDNREKSEKLRIANAEIHNLLHAIPAITILRMVAYYYKNK